ncbi:MAG: heme biosynthesis HemY N-terminal domain-containing protein [Porticoccus sp.]
MRLLLLMIALITFIAGFVAWQMLEGSGYVLIAFGNYTIDMSLWTLVLLILVLWVLVRLLTCLLRAMVEPGQKFLRNRVSVRQQRYRKRTAKGLLQFIEGRWSQARNNLKRAAKHSDMPLVNYLAAANAAYELGDKEDANRLLVKAEQVAPGGELAIGLAQAKMYLQDERYEEALAILQRLHQSASDHPLVLRLLERAHRGLNDWRSLEKLLPDLRRFKVYDKPTLLSVESEVYSSLMLALAGQAKSSGKSDDTKALIQLWQEMPSAIRADKQVLLSYISSLHQLGESNLAESLLRKSLKTNWDDALVRLYGLVGGDDPQKQLIIGEAWLRERPNDPELMLALGRLSQRNQLWGKARDYLESSLALRAQPDAYAELARLMVQLGEHEKSAQYYQQGLMLSAHV